MYRIMLVSWGGIREELMGGLSSAEAEDICEGYGWVFCEEEGGCVWDLEIEKEPV